MFRKNIFIKNRNVELKANEASCSCPFVSKYSTIYHHHHQHHHRHIHEGVGVVPVS